MRRSREGGAGGSRRRPGKPRQRLQLDMELRFEQEVRQVPAGIRPEVLAWLRRWRRRPERVFWEVTPTGDWRRI